MTTTLRPFPAAPAPAPVPAAGAAPRAAATYALSGRALLDLAADLLLGGLVPEAMELLATGLRALRAGLAADAWTAFATGTCARHPVARLLAEDPLTGRSAAQPRGYPGDAGTLDLVYRAVPLPADTTALGASVYACTADGPACRALRWRRDHLARALDAEAARVERPRVLSMACGHLRELERSRAAHDGRLGPVLALDEDARSLAHVRQAHAGRDVTAVPGSVRDVLAGRVAAEGMDLVYAAGLYDRLPLPVACRLTARLFAMLRPGGRVLVANVCPELRDAGYMEAFMRWPLIHRREDDMHAIACALPAAQTASRRVYRDPAGDVVYLEVERA